MTRRTSITTLLSTLVLIGAIFGGSPPAQGFQDTPDRTMSGSIAAIAGEFGDSNGHITIVGPTGAPMVFAHAQQVWEIYTFGDDIYSDDRFAFCSQDASGGLGSCLDLDIVAPGGQTDYDCHEDPEGGDWCECDDVYDCIELFRAGECVEPLYCEDIGCVCLA